MESETLEESAIDYSAEVYENTGKQAPMGLMELGGEIQGP